ncbi:succinyl-diaminopimelate desuccinylase [Rickettsia typhi]|uniref:Succinyl-diaminopimelate desuccinylase n=2 Tax=Rickettsia typhi TaxID=785 RepID=DAPE_RICTY|nr:succinyl-diaminopimelate desuccinylase [Rickettsia typhi]Q68VN9.1 RecName: Full=Succinyl-diaminopimelate desuccinylase; Short=SDAP desuccinylase; AltName: Full=N-succinyl-LL-2,6-diaminoheptanedioate amidohydrolase [Rickettsia typhi str. Wilmington]AAU04317.1 succinyl-diaminopimelate desuccinylase [Rickettsia typhi str. Wilmington]AFE54694.1 succinyl-diaminopimelate desuccinylase [Rickettsia typhi str. TH1527]AFE55533.1 succinyl-diaminopimelate desuccinylase [Rickettsia typhi str. B9991CWPP]
MYTHYLKNLISFESVTPNSAGAVEYIDGLLKQHGFKTEIKIFGDSKNERVTNLYGVFGSNEPNICFVGHVDVVPAGNHEFWHNSNPFKFHEQDGKIYGRGAVDMKGAIACFLAASLNFIKNNMDFKGSISFLITSDEEGKSTHGTKEMLQYIYDQRYKIDFAVVGEPTCEKEIGDTIKIGRRGSVNFKLNIVGLAGHVAYPHKANNPLPCLIKILNELTNIRLDEGTEFFQNSNLEVTNIDVGNDILNTIPASAEACFNIRFNSLHSVETLSQLIEQIIKQYCKEYKVDYKLEYSSSAESFVQNPNDNDKIKEFADVIERTLKIKSEFSTSGGTSDARFVKDYCSLVEFGLLSEMAHKINEYTKISDLQKLYDVYYNFLMEIF